MRLIAVLATPCLLLLGGCVAAYPPAHPPIPPVLAEQVPVPPRSSVVLIWQPGHYDWNGVTYSWVSGKWVERTGHGTLWQDGYWRQSADTSTWVPAHWL